MIAKTPGFVNGAPLLLLQLEGLAVAIVSIVAFSRSGESWRLFAALILAPDLSILFYLAGPRTGAAFYNALHIYLGPIALFAASAALAAPVGIAAALIWCAHIGIDRALGFGLKYGGGFALTHLGRIGPSRTRLSIGRNKLQEPCGCGKLAPLSLAPREGFGILAPGLYFEILVHMRGAPGVFRRELAMSGGEGYQHRAGQGRHHMERGQSERRSLPGNGNARNGLRHCRAGSRRLFNEHHAFGANENRSKFFAREGKHGIPGGCLGFHELPWPFGAITNEVRRRIFGNVGGCGGELPDNAVNR
jgi:hypothetical protein